MMIVTITCELSLKSLYLFYKIFSILQAIKCSKKKQQPKNNKKDNDNNNINNNNNNKRNVADPQQKLISDYPHCASAASAIAQLNNSNTAAVDATIFLHGKQQQQQQQHQQQQQQQQLQLNEYEHGDRDQHNEHAQQGGK